MQARALHPPPWQAGQDGQGGGRRRIRSPVSSRSEPQPTGRTPFSAARCFRAPSVRRSTVASVQATTREQVIVALLERYEDLVEPWVGPGSSGLVGVPLMPPTYTADVRELERLLKRMRTSERGLWWHVNEHFLAARWATREVVVARRGKHGKRVTASERRLVRVGDRSDPRLVEDGVAWLAEMWGLEHEPMLPALMLV
jgi:hypothetical protein